MKIFFLGICGSGMGNVACMLQAQGHTIFGADEGVYPPISTLLEKAGISVQEGYGLEGFLEFEADLCVVGNAIARGNPILEYLMEHPELPHTAFPLVLGEKVIGGRHSMVVSGTHGKTTTSSLLTYLLEQNGRQPGYFIGGVPRDLASGAELGNEGEPFVVEGDEYDTAFFDKRSKFVHYRPRTLIINNIEFDHADIFRDTQDVLRAFEALLKLVPPQGCVLYNADDTNSAKLVPVRWTHCYSVGLREGADLQICGFETRATGVEFELRWKGQFWTKVKLGLSGMFNARNAAMAILAAALEVSPEDPMQAEIELGCLREFKGVERRMDILRQEEGFTLLEDFAHHPSAIAQTLETLKERYPGQTLTVCFEPRSNTTATRRFQGELTNALKLADAVLIAPVHKPERFPEEERLDTQKMETELKDSGKECRAFESFAELEDALKKRAKEGGVCAILTNGALGGILAKLRSARGEVLC